MNPGPEKYDAPYEKCPVCGDSGIYHLLTDFRNNVIYKCPHCKVQFMNPVYSDDYLAEYYSDYNATEIPADQVDAKTAANTIVFDAIEHFTEQPGRMLDFGCGNGNAAVFARSRGWEVSGYDVDCDTTRIVSRKYEFPVACGEFSEALWEKEKFDLIHCHHVLEHVKDPLRILGQFRNLMAVNGLLYIGVPNISAASARVKFRLEKLGIRRKNIGKYYDSDHHVFYYQPGSLRTLVELAGFEVLTIQTPPKERVIRNPLLRYIQLNILDRLYQHSAFFLIARKTA